MTFSSTFGIGLGLGIVGAIGYGIYKGLKDDKPSKARLAMRNKTNVTPAVPNVSIPVETKALPVVETKVTPVTAEQPVVIKPDPKKFRSYCVEEAVDKKKRFISIKDLRDEAYEYIFEENDGEIFEEDREWFEEAVDDLVEKFIEEAKGEKIRVLR